MVNGYAIVVLIALLGDYVLSVVVDLLNLRAMRPEPPASLASVYDPETYRRSQEYTGVRTRFGLWPRTFNLALLLGFWLTGGFEALDQWLRGFGQSSVVNGLLFFGILLGGQQALNLPFQLYSTFVIEERFGFNRTTARTFVTDLAKGLALAVALGAPFGALILWLFEMAGSLAWLYCWGATAALVLLMQFVAPSWLMPIFMKFTPLPDGPLRERIMAYARSVDFPLDNLFVVDGSRRSSRANAFFTGFGKNRRIGLYDTLIERHTTDELVAVVAHEVGHYKKRHVTSSMLVAIAQLGLLFFVFGYFMRQVGLFEAFQMSEMSVYAGLLFCGLLYGPVDLLMSLVLHARSRKHEYEADRFSVETTGLGQALAEGLKKLAANNLGNLTPHPAHVLLHHTHPPLAERIAAIEAASAEQQQPQLADAG